MYHIYREQVIPCSLKDAWEFFSTPKNLNKLTPPSIGFRITHCKSEKMHEGQLIGYKVKVLPGVWVNWLTEITKVKESNYFIDDQRIGPYKVWHHTHRFKEHHDGILMTDEVTYALNFRILGRIANALYVEKKLQYIFDERQRLIKEIFRGENDVSFERARPGV